MTTLRIALAQTHPVMGDFEANVEKISDYVSEAKTSEVDLVCFGELAVSGYPPQDLLFRDEFVAADRAALLQIAKQADGIDIIVGALDSDGSNLFNAAHLLRDGKIVSTSRKTRLPNYEVFDEKRYFTPGEPAIFDVSGVKIGVPICEDIWGGNEVCAGLVSEGAELLLIPNASPFNLGKSARRSALLAQLSESTDTPLGYVNVVGAQDGLIFDGDTQVAGQGWTNFKPVETFTQGLGIWDWDQSDNKKTNTHPQLDEMRSLYEASVAGVRDYVADNGFSDVVIGLSGGIDSALTVAVAALALGAERVHAVTMPSRYSSDHSVSDSLELCERLGIDVLNLPIEAMHQSFVDTIGLVLEDSTGDRMMAPLADENLQSRIRGVSLMGISNHFGWLVLATGNKTEAAVGYSTLYGDTVGAYGVIKDLWKHQVYELARWINSNHNSPIPANIISKPPSAELRPDQTDEQSLGDYDSLDEILRLYIEQEQSLAQIVAAGHDSERARRIVSLVDRAEFKRRQSAIGTRISKMAFGTDRRVPITNRFRGFES